MASSEWSLASWTTMVATSVYFHADSDETFFEEGTLLDRCIFFCLLSTCFQINLHFHTLEPWWVRCCIQETFLIVPVQQIFL